MLNLADYKDDDKAFGVAFDVFMNVMDDMGELVTEEAKTRFPASLTKGQIDEYRIGVVRRSFAALRPQSHESEPGSSSKPGCRHSDQGKEPSDKGRACLGGSR